MRAVAIQTKSKVDVGARGRERAEDPVLSLSRHSADGRDATMDGVLTDHELRQILLERGPAWIRAQAATYGAMGGALPEGTATLFRPFFGPDVDRARVALARIEDPPFYPELRPGPGEVF